MRAETRQRRNYRYTELSLEDIARIYNPVLQGWINYYGRYYRSALYSVFRHFNKTLVAWARRKFKWSGLSNGSGVSREVHAPFCERLAGRFRWPTLQYLCSTGNQNQSADEL